MTSDRPENPPNGPRGPNAESDARGANADSDARGANGDSGDPVPEPAETGPATPVAPVADPVSAPASTDATPEPGDTGPATPVAPAADPVAGAPPPADGPVESSTERPIDDASEPAASPATSATPETVAPRTGSPVETTEAPAATPAPATETTETASVGEPAAPTEMAPTPARAETPAVEAPTRGADELPAAAAADSAPGEAGEVAGRPGPSAEQIEWRPVVTGEQIEWQPVLKSDSEADVSSDELVEDAGAVEDEGVWEQPVAAGRPRAAGASGAVGRPRRPPGSRPRSKSDGGPPREGKPSNQRRQVILLSVLTGVVVVVAVLGVILSRGAQETGSSATAPPTTGRPTGSTVAATELTTFRDDVTGFTIRYPRVWNRLQPPIADIRLVLIAGENDALQVRILPIQTPATRENIANFKAVTDAIVFGDMSNKLVQEQLVTLNGKLTYYYLYTFNDQATGQQGVHAHYFVFEGHRMYSLVFQALPAEDFPRLAAVYDQVAESFNVPPEQPGTTAAPPTTAR